MPNVSRPLIAAVNHSAWWDPVVALHLSHEPFRRDQYGIMEGSQLLRYPFFQRIGGFGVTSTSPGDTRALADLAVTLLSTESRRLLWVFPQGRLLPASIPLHFRSGVVRIARRCADAVVVPIAFRYPMVGERRPECIVRIGNPVDVGGGSVGEATRSLEAAVARELSVIDDDLLHERRDGYRKALEGGRSIADRYDRRARRGQVS